MKLCSPNSCGTSSYVSPLAAFPAFARLVNDAALGTAPRGRLNAYLDENADSFVAHFDVPGVKKEDVKLDLDGTDLSITVERRIGETSYTAARTLTLPESANPEAITAALADGVLTVTLPKQEARKPRSITIN